MSPLLIVAILGGLSILILFIGLARTLSAPAGEIEERIDRYTGKEAAKPEKSTKDEEERAVPAFVSSLDRAIAKQSFAERTATDLARANFKLTVVEYFLFTIGTTIGGLLLGFLLLHNVLALLGAIIGYLVPTILVKMRQGQRLRSFNDQLGDTISLLANSLRSGYSLLQSMETVARELAPPMSEEFRRVVREIGLGLSHEEALRNLLRRINSDDLELMVTAINVHHEVGGNLSEILEVIGHTIRERVRIQGEIRVLTSMQRYTGYILGGLPFVLGLYLYIMNPTYMSGLTQGSCGIIMLGTAGLMLGVGFLLIRKIVAIEV
jgi:tight adherence protein B